MRLAVLLGVTVSLASLALGGCAASDNGSKEEVGTYEGELKLSSPKLLGTIANGETKSGYYYNPPRYRAYSFAAKAGDQITVDVHSVEGDAMAWITDSGYNSLAANDDANSHTLDSHVTYTVPSNSLKTSFRIVFRDYDLLDATFDVHLQIQSAKGPTDPTDPDPGTCNPANEPWRTYKGTPSTCPFVRFTCPVGTANFQNACGCGCESPH